MVKMTTRDKGCQKRLQKLAKKFPQKAFNMLRWMAHRTVELTVSKVATPTGGVLKKRTGVLASGYRTEIKKHGTGRVTARAYTTVVYDPILELGGIINHPGSRVRAKQSLHFWSGGQEIFCKSTKPHRIRIKARPHFYPSANQAVSEGSDKLRSDWWRT